MAALSISEKDSSLHVPFIERHSKTETLIYRQTENILYSDDSSPQISSSPFLGYTKAFLVMLAIPTYLVSSAVFGPSLSSFYRSRTDQTQSTAPASPVTSNTDAFASILGPVLTDNFPDPAVIVVDGLSYAFATNNRGIGKDLIHVQMATSTDNSTWNIMTGVDALPKVGAWESGNRIWAPDVVRLDNGTFVLYYSGETIWSPAHHCIGAATSQNITGPYIPLSYPFACPDVKTQGGAIDPDGFLDSDGRRYVTYKIDGNSIGHGGSCGNGVAPQVPTPIILQEVNKDGITKIGASIQILDRDVYDGPLIEAPSLHRSDEGVYFLFFSSNCYTGPLYDTSYATAMNITGPYTKTDRPLYITGDGPDLFGPGGTDILFGGEMIVFHGHMQQSRNGRSRAGLSFVRGMYTATPKFKGRSVSLA